MAAVKLPALHSTETIQSMLDPKDPELFEKIALWMLDASEQDIAAYWTEFHKVSPGRSWEEDLIFMNWTRLNPQAAIAAASSIPEIEHIPWWGWASHDPDAAMAAARAAGGNRVSNVLLGAGQNQPDWIRDHLSELSAEEQSQALYAIAYWQDGRDPKGDLDRSIERHLSFNDKTFDALVDQDPWEAMDWLKKNSAEVSRRYGDTSRVENRMYATLAESQPEVLARLIAQTPDGETRRRMDQARFNQLAKTDPEGALKEAAALKAPYLSTQRMAAVGVNFVDSDPERAFALMDQILKANPKALNDQGTTIWYPNGSSSRGGDGTAGVNLLSAALVSKDPARFLESQDSNSTDYSPYSGTNNFNYVAGLWANQDLSGFQNWVNSQQDAAIRAKTVPIVVQQTLSQGRYDEAAQWVMAMPDGKDQLRTSQINNVIGNWFQQDAAACQAWLESAPLTDKERESANRTLEMYQTHQ